MEYKNMLDAYLKIQRKTGSPREIESEALTLGATKLIYCKNHWDSSDRKGLLSAALKYNQKLWTIFQAGLAGAKNPLPKNIKLNLLRISAYVDKQIFSIMADPSPEKLMPIIDINLGLAAGLRARAAPRSSGPMAEKLPPSGRIEEQKKFI